MPVNAACSLSSRAGDSREQNMTIHLLALLTKATIDLGAGCQ